MNRISFLLLFLLAFPALAQQPSSTEEEPALPQKESSGSLMWLLPTVLALGAGGYAWFVGERSKREVARLRNFVFDKKRQRTPAKASVPALAPVTKDDRAVQALDKRVGSLEKELEELRTELKRRTRAQQQPLIKSQPSQLTVQPLPSMMETVSKATVPVTPAGPQTKWAKYADAGDGFNAASLSDEQDGEKIFELSVEGTNGNFRVVSERGPQQMALHDPTFYLNKACTYDTLPTPQSAITTETPGTLKLVGGKWTIQRPAKIRFN